MAYLQQHSGPKVRPDQERRGEQLHTQLRAVAEPWLAAQPDVAHLELKIQIIWREADVVPDLRS